MITENKLKILVLCKGGLVRSVTVKHLIVENYNDVDVLAAGGCTIQMDETRKMLCDWADLILVVSHSAYKKLCTDTPEYKSKTTYLPIGKDVWGTPMHYNLVKHIKDNWMGKIDEAIKKVRNET